MNTILRDMTLGGFSMDTTGTKGIWGGCVGKGGEAPLQQPVAGTEGKGWANLNLGTRWPRKEGGQGAGEERRRGGGGWELIWWDRGHF